MLSSDILFHKSISLSNSQLKVLKFCSFQNNFLLTFCSVNFLFSKYLIIPFEIHFIKVGSKIIFYSLQLNIKSIFYSFIVLFLKNLKYTDKIYNQKLILKGLGLRITSINEKGSNLLRFKLGFSHTIDISLLNSNISAVSTMTSSFNKKKGKKNILILRHDDICFLNNFSASIKRLKLPNSYTGKGFRYKNEKIRLKTFKKTK